MITTQNLTELGFSEILNVFTGKHLLSAAFLLVN